MKKLERLKLNIDGLTVFEKPEMQLITGGYGSGNGYDETWYAFKCRCDNGKAYMMSGTHNDAVNSCFIYCPGRVSCICTEQ